MKSKHIYLLISFTFIFSTFESSFAQLGHSNMYLLSNLNQHYTSTLYSALWGYKAPNGREYAILGCPQGTAFIDITDSANIHEVDYVSGPTSSWREMKVYSHYAYIVSEASNSKVQIIDLQYLPDSVNLVGTSNMANHSTTHSISQSGPYLYLNGCNTSFGRGVTIVDVTNPVNLIKRGSFNTEYVHDCRVLNDTIWAANIYNPPGTISVINATDKNSLNLVSSWVNNPNPFPHNCAITNDRRHILTTDETSNPPGKLKVWNIEDIYSPQFVTSWQPTGITTAIVHNVEIYGNFAVIAHYSAGVRVVNITNPAAPVEVAWYDTYPSNNSSNFNGCWGVYMFPSGKIIASDRQTGLYVLKTTFNIVGNNNQNTELPDKYKLEQNYPNPFNPSTSIRYSLTKNSYITIKVFDVLGKQVALLADEYKQAGNHSVTFDASHLSSGVYFYTLSSPEFTNTKRMVLNK